MRGHPLGRGLRGTGRERDRGKRDFFCQRLNPCHFFFKNQSLITAVSGDCGRNGGDTMEGDSLSGTDLSYSSWRGGLQQAGPWAYRHGLSLSCDTWLCRILAKFGAKPQIHGTGSSCVLKERTSATESHKAQRAAPWRNHLSSGQATRRVSADREQRGRAAAQKQGYDTHSSPKQSRGFRGTGTGNRQTGQRRRRSRGGARREPTLT